MIKFASGLFLVGIALVPFSGATFNPDGSIQASVKTDGQIIYQVIASSGDRCTMMVHAINGSSSKMASPQAECASLDKRIDSIRTWATNPDGTVILKNYSNQEVLFLETVGAGVYSSAGLGDAQFTFRRD